MAFVTLYVLYITCVHVGHFVYVLKQYCSAFLALLHFTCLDFFRYILTTFTAIRQEIRDIEEGKMDKTNNPLKVWICPPEINSMINSLYFRNWLVRAQWGPSVILADPFSRKGDQKDI